MAHILIVEDHHDTREYLVAIMAGEGHECVTCASAEEADALLCCQIPDLAIIDINLPGKHGAALAWNIRKHHRDLPIVILSAILDQWDRDDLVDCGANAVLAKPCPVADALETVERLLAGKTGGRKREKIRA